MKVRTVLDMSSANQILENHGLASGGKVQQYVTSNLIKTFDSYVPFRDGFLKASALSNSSAPYEYITYSGPYAKRLYHNPQYNFNGAPMRGGYWASRAWADNKDAFLNDLQQYVRRD